MKSKDVLREIRKILKNPSMKTVSCPSCGGKGYFITGAISTETCKKCEVWHAAGYSSGSGKIKVQNDAATARRIKRFFSDVSTEGNK